MEVAELCAPVLVIAYHMIVEAPLPDAPALKPACSRHPPEGAVEPPHDDAEGGLAGEREQDVVVVGHDDIAVEDEVAAVARFGP